MTETARSLEAPAWQTLAAEHRDRVFRLAGPYLEERGRGKKHPVYDFLFEYYSFRPGSLMAWSPGFGITLTGRAAASFLAMPGFERRGDGVCLAAERMPARRVAALRWVTELLRATAVREPRFRCSGLHEWAMVFDEQNIRHRQFPLRLPHREVVRIVREGPVCCSHFDAFRFFPATARPFNQLQPSASTRHETEQRGCLHANMDLYKWAYKFHPWTPGELLLDAFDLAWRIREVDMRASPYDLDAFGLASIPVETHEGRDQYRTLQQGFADEAQPIRRRLMRHYERLLAGIDTAAGGSNRKAPIRPLTVLPGKERNEPASG